MNQRFIDEKNPFLDHILEYVDEGSPFYAVKMLDELTADEVYIVPFSQLSKIDKGDITEKKLAGYTVNLNDTVSSVVSNLDRSLTHEAWSKADVVTMKSLKIGMLMIGMARYKCA